MEYIRQARREFEGCLFCDALRDPDDGSAMILYRSDHGFVLMNAYPYNPGHVMIAPVRHTGDPQQLSRDELADLGELLQRSVKALTDEMHPDGFNVGMNLGKVAGAGVPDHLHWHVVPRWNGDTNFMTVTGEMRVLPESLEATYKKLRPRFGGRSDRSEFDRPPSSNPSS
jgi:ATP adenylyltransferase